MRFWLASNVPEMVERYLKIGVFDGVITNPDLIADTGRSYPAVLQQLCDVAPEVFFQVPTSDPDEMNRVAEKAISVNPERVRLKVPATANGLVLINTLSSTGRRPMATCAPTTASVLMAASAGAELIAPYASVLKRYSVATKLSELQRMQQALRSQPEQSRLCVGIYDPADLYDYASLGIRTAFLWEKDVEAFAEGYLVREAEDGFADSWSRIRDVM